MASNEHYDSSNNILRNIDVSEDTFTTNTDCIEINMKNTDHISNSTASLPTNPSLRSTNYTSTYFNLILLHTLLLLVVPHIFVHGALIDLSYAYPDEMPSYPGFTPLHLTVIARGLNKYGIWFEINDLCTSEHSGTHMDAPVHFSKDMWTIGDIPIERMYRRPGVLVDVSRQASSMLNYEVRVQDLERWEAAHGTMPDGAVVLLRTGWPRYTGNITAYAGIDEFQKKNFPSFGLEAARWLASHGHMNRHVEGVVGVGVDTLSIDVGQSVRGEVHVLLFGNNIYGMENLVNLHLLPPKGFLITALPLRVKGGSASPTRVVAEVLDEDVAHALTAAAAAHRGSATAVAAAAVFIITLASRQLC